MCVGGCVTFSVKHLQLYPTFNSFYCSVYAYMCTMSSSAVILRFVARGISRVALKSCQAPNTRGLSLISDSYGMLQTCDYLPVSKEVAEKGHSRDADHLPGGWEHSHDLLSNSSRRHTLRQLQASLHFCT
jgi:hypothetical protein